MPSSCRSVISVKLVCSFIEITLWNGCSPVNLLHIFRTPVLRNTSRWLLLHYGLFATIEQLLIKSLFYSWMKEV